MGGKVVFRFATNFDEVDEMASSSCRIGRSSRMAIDLALGTSILEVKSDSVAALTCLACTH